MSQAPNVGSSVDAKRPPLNWTRFMEVRVLCSPGIASWSLTPTIARLIPRTDSRLSHYSPSTRVLLSPERALRHTAFVHLTPTVSLPFSCSSPKPPSRVSIYGQPRPLDAVLQSVLPSCCMRRSHARRCVRSGSFLDILLILARCPQNCSHHFSTTGFFWCTYSYFYDHRGHHLTMFSPQ